MSCSELARAAGLPLAGTAGRAERWLLLEHRPPWGPDGTDDSGLPEALVAWFREIEDRVHLIRGPGRPDGPPVAFAARTTESGGSLVRLPVERLEDVMYVDPVRDGLPVEAPLVLVCTHARRDVCCGTNGVPVFNALRRHVPRELLWRSSHQGGHRFAANVLALPEAVQLGRVLPDAAEDVARSLAERRIPLRFYRGRTLHAPEVQAADAAVRAALELDRLTDVRLVEHDGARVFLATPSGSVEVTVEERDGPMLPASCGKEAEPMRVLEATVQGLEPAVA
ncbi:MAG TPA: sucrase ferredoxin [Gaiella sp.]|nr:sucrase ferredoxin [Gaiella sp.]